jgi:integrase/recombinase XerD
MLLCTTSWKEWFYRPIDMFQLLRFKRRTTKQPLYLSSQMLEAYCWHFASFLDVKSSSKNTYVRQLKVFLAWALANQEFILDQEALLKFKAYLSKKNLSPYTVNSYLVIVKKLFKWLASQNICPDITQNIKPIKRKHGFKKEALSIDQAKKLLLSINRSGIAGKRDYALINIMLRTGLRTIEIVKAIKADIASHSGEAVLWIQGKGRDSKDEFVVLTEPSLLSLREYLYARGNVKENDHLFVSHSTKNFGKALTTRSVSRIVKQRLREIGIIDSRFTAHSLRHTAITFSLLAGATPQEARAMARHADINTTLIYAHNIQRIEQAPERKIDELLAD